MSNIVGIRVWVMQANDRGLEYWREVRIIPLMEKKRITSTMAYIRNPFCIGILRHNRQVSDVNIDIFFAYYICHGTTTVPAVDLVQLSVALTAQGGTDLYMILEPTRKTAL
jgi:hypothetical protein